MYDEKAIVAYAESTGFVHSIRYTAQGISIKLQDSETGVAMIVDIYINDKESEAYKRISEAVSRLINMRIKKTASDLKVSVDLHELERLSLGGMMYDGLTFKNDKVNFLSGLTYDEDKLLELVKVALNILK